MESTLNKEKVMVQRLITSVPAASGGEQTGLQSSSSSVCKKTISEVGNLASVIENASRSLDKEINIPEGVKSNTYDNKVKSTQAEPNTQTSISKNPDGNEQKAERFRLCGAAQRRFKIYMEKGMSNEKAHKLCLKPMRDFDIPTTTNRTKGITPGNPNDPKKAIGSSAANTSGSKSAFNTTVKQNLQPSQKDVVEDIQLSKEAEVPRAKKSKQEVKDQDNKNSPSLKQPLTMEKSKISQEKVVVGFFPNSLNDETDRIISFIQWQNEGLYVFAWKLLERSINNGNVMLRFLIDKLSAAKLEEIKGEIFYKFRQIKLHIGNYEEKK